MHDYKSTVLLTYQQVIIIKDLIAATKSKPKAFVNRLGYPSVEEIPQSEFLLVVGRLAYQLKATARRA
ncbi:MAG: hypothetical protein JNJ81_11660 [Candidatus Accumulibacter sp.]|nr:hypothetical protein [Accumulibacter sp.]